MIPKNECEFKIQMIPFIASSSVQHVNIYVFLTASVFPFPSMITCPPVNLSVLYISAKLAAGLSVSKFVPRSSLSVSFKVDPTICFTCPEWRSMHGRNFIVRVRYEEIA